MARAGVVAVEVPPSGGKSIENYRPSDQEIATRAHEIFLDRGATDGHDVDDWLRAEKELRERNDKSAMMADAKP